MLDCEDGDERKFLVIASSASLTFQHLRISRKFSCNDLKTPGSVKKKVVTKSWLRRITRGSDGGNICSRSDTRRWSNHFRVTRSLFCLGLSWRDVVEAFGQIGWTLIGFLTSPSHHDGHVSLGAFGAMCSRAGCRCCRLPLVCDSGIIWKQCYVAERSYSQVQCDEYLSLFVFFIVLRELHSYTL